MLALNRTSVFAVLILSLFAGVTLGNVYEVIQPDYLPATGCECLAWNAVSPNDPAFQNKVNAMFLAGAPPADAANHCLMPGATAGNGLKDGATFGPVEVSFAGSWCYCKPAAAGATSAAPPVATYCTPPQFTPEQINLQAAGAGVVVASFVTFEPKLSSVPPVVQWGTDASKLTETTSGVSHWYTEPTGSKRTYVMNFVKMSGLKPHTEYSYRVKSGATEGKWSAVFTYRSLYATGVTRIGMYGDMGHSHYNCYDNLLTDCKSGAIDVIAHMGDQ